MLKNLQEKTNPNQLWIPRKQSSVYSAHFADGRSSKLIPYPLLHLGYDSEPKVKHNVSSCSKPKYTDFVQETNNSLPEVLRMLLTRSEKASKLE